MTTAALATRRASATHRAVSAVPEQAANQTDGFVCYTPDKKVDIKKSLKTFENYLHALVKSNEDMKPTIIKELTEWKRLGETVLVSYTLHALHLPATGENIDRIKGVLADLEGSNVIRYNANEAGSRRGRNAGWVLVGSEEENEAEEVPTTK